MRLALLGVLAFFLAIAGGYWYGLQRRLARERLPAPPPPPSRAAPKPPGPAPLPAPGLDLPSDERRRRDSIPPPSSAK